MKINKTILIMLVAVLATLGILIWERFNAATEKAALKQELTDIKNSFKQTVDPINTALADLKKQDAEKNQIITDMLIHQSDLEKAKTASDKAAKDAIDKLLAAKPEDQVTEVKRITGEQNIQYFADRKTVEFSLAAFATAAGRLKAGEHFDLVERVQFQGQIQLLKNTIQSLQEVNAILHKQLAMDDARWEVASKNIADLEKLVHKAIHKPFGTRLLEFGKDFAIGFAAGYVAHK